MNQTPDIQTPLPLRFHSSEGEAEFRRLLTEAPGATDVAWECKNAADGERVPGKEAKVKPVKRPMTDDERRVIPLLWSQVNYPPPPWDKRFAREIQYVMTDGLITEGQSGQVWRIFKRYRRQIVCEDKERLLGVAEGRLREPQKDAEDAKKEPLIENN